MLHVRPAIHAASSCIRFESIDHQRGKTEERPSILDAAPDCLVNRSCLLRLVLEPGSVLQAEGNRLGKHLHFAGSLGHWSSRTRVDTEDEPSMVSWQEDSR